MKNLITIIVLLVSMFLFYIMTNKSYPKEKSITSHNVSKQNIIPVSKEDILIENRGTPNQVLGDFPIPQTTSDSKSLSLNYPEDLSIITSGKYFKAKPHIEHRNSKYKMNQLNYPNHHLKDNLSKNTLKSTQYKFAEVDNTKSESSWSDENISQYPNYYTSQLKDEITNIGAFFDVNNNYVDTTSHRTDAKIHDICYESKDGEKVCLDNSRQYNIPPSLINNTSNCGFLNSIGLLEKSSFISQKNEKVFNGGTLYDNVTASKQNNLSYETPIKPQIMSCSI